MEDQPWQPDEHHRDDNQRNQYVFHRQLLPLGLERGLHGFELGVDRFRGLEFGNLFFEALRRSQRQRVGASLGEIGTALEQLELGERFLRAASQNVGKRLFFSTETIKLLAAYDWPGNVRELENAIERAALHARGTEVVAEDLPTKMQTSEMRNRAAHARSPLTAIYADLISLDELERRYLIYVLETVGGNRTRAAHELGISRATLINKIKRYDFKM